VQSLGATPVAFGVIGDDDSGRVLSGLLDEMSADTDGVLRQPGRHTTEKMRVFGGTQQVVRIDAEETDGLSESDAAAVLDKVATALNAGYLDALIVEDYGKGLVTKELMQAIVEIAQKSGVRVALDPHPANAMNVKGLCLMTPNRAEAFALAGAYHVAAPDDGNEDRALLEVVEKLEALWAPEYLLVTLGAHGMALFKEGQSALHVPTKAQEVFDVSGAGDTVISAFTLALVAGANAEEACVFANHAAGIVVGKVGTAPVYSEELRASFASD
jgi:D-beta-D-heptose 7-phosphate kinase/D-beta-D-heptose 1-phosphate adenosyltransferase